MQPDRPQQEPSIAAEDEMAADSDKDFDEDVQHCSKEKTLAQGQHAPGKACSSADLVSVEDGSQTTQHLHDKTAQRRSQRVADRRKMQPQSKRATFSQCQSSPNPGTKTPPSRQKPSHVLHETQSEQTPPKVEQAAPGPQQQQAVMKCKKDAKKVGSEARSCRSGSSQRVVEPQQQTRPAKSKDRHERSDSRLDSHRDRLSCGRGANHARHRAAQPVRKARVAASGAEDARIQTKVAQLQKDERGTTEAENVSRKRKADNIFQDTFSAQQTLQSREKHQRYVAELESQYLQAIDAKEWNRCIMLKEFIARVKGDAWDADGQAGTQPSVTAERQCDERLPDTITKKHLAWLVHQREKAKERADWHECQRIEDELTELLLEAESESRQSMSGTSQASRGLRDSSMQDLQLLQRRIGLLEKELSHAKETADFSRCLDLEEQLLQLRQDAEAAELAAQHLTIGARALGSDEKKRKAPMLHLEQERAKRAKDYQQNQSSEAQLPMLKQSIIFTQPEASEAIDAEGDDALRQRISLLEDQQKTAAGKGEWNKCAQLDEELTRAKAEMNDVAKLRLCTAQHSLLHSSPVLQDEKDVAQQKLDGLQRQLDQAKRDSNWTQCASIQQAMLKVKKDEASRACVLPSHATGDTAEALSQRIKTVESHLSEATNAGEWNQCAELDKELIRLRNDLRVAQTHQATKVAEVETAVKYQLKLLEEALHQTKNAKDWKKCQALTTEIDKLKSELAIAQTPSHGAASSGSCPGGNDASKVTALNQQLKLLEESLDQTKNAKDWKKCQALATEIDKLKSELTIAQAPSHGAASSESSPPGKDGIEARQGTIMSVSDIRKPNATNPPRIAIHSARVVGVGKVRQAFSKGAGKGAGKSGGKNGGKNAGKGFGKTGGKSSEQEVVLHICDEADGAKIAIVWKATSLNVGNLLHALVNIANAVPDKSDPSAVHLQLDDKSSVKTVLNRTDGPVAVYEPLAPNLWTIGQANSEPLHSEVDVALHCQSVSLRSLSSGNGEFLNVVFTDRSGESMTMQVFDHEEGDFEAGKLYIAFGLGVRPGRVRSSAYGYVDDLTWHQLKYLSWRTAFTDALA